MPQACQADACPGVRVSPKMKLPSRYNLRISSTTLAMASHWSQVRAICRASLPRRSACALRGSGLHLFHVQPLEGYQYGSHGSCTSQSGRNNERDLDARHVCDHYACYVFRSKIVPKLGRTRSNYCQRVHVRCCARKRVDHAIDKSRLRRSQRECTADGLENCDVLVDSM